jgi:hypothetical protein
LEDDVSAFIMNKEKRAADLETPIFKFTAPWWLQGK